MSETVGCREEVLPVLQEWWTAASYLRERTGAPTAGKPDWADIVDRALAEAPAEGVWPPEDGNLAGTRGFAQPLRPFLAVTRHRLFDTLDGRAGMDLDADLDAVWADAASWLEGMLTELASRTLVVELHAARKAGALLGSTGRQRFRDFVRRVSGRDALAELMRRYPVLARLLGERCAHTADVIAELLHRFAADRDALRATLLSGADPGRLTSVELGSGDLHAGGRAVAMLRFEDGRRLVYKPRPLGLQARWNELLGWFAAAHPELAPSAVDVLVRDGYGWAEFIPATPVSTRAGIELFYRRQGALLALLYALDAVDMHCENLIACGDQPVVVDVETLFHPGWTPQATTGHDPALTALHASVTRAALLPNIVLGEHGALDVSAFGAESGEDFPADLAAWVDAGTDTMHLVRTRWKYQGGANRPVLAGAPASAVDPAQHRGSLLSGFRTAYETVLDRRHELVGADGLLARFADEEIRLIMRETQSYAMLLSESTHPDLLTDALDRERSFDQLHVEGDPEHLRTLLPFELEDLCGGDVPMFTTQAGSRDVRSSGGHGLRNLLARSGLDSAYAKIARLGAVDMREQEWLIDATLATKHKTVEHGDGPALPGAVARVLPDEQHVLAMACAIGDELLGRSHQDGPRANWVGLELVEGRHWSVLPMGAGLADGYSGTALFLAQLGALTGMSRYLDLARRAMHPLPRLLAALVEHPDLAREVGPGAFFGLGGVAYALARVSNLLGDTELAALVPVALAAMEAADTGTVAGVGEGAGGALAASRAVYAETGLPEAAVVAGRLADRLATLPAHADRGFLHGRAGVDWALRRPVLGRHGDLACLPKDLGWCSGAAGVVLAAYAESRPGDGDQPADAFVHAVSARPPLRDQSLCHGELGTMEALVELAAHGHDPATTELGRTSARLLGVIKQYGTYCGTPHGVWSPGLLTGIAGIGYGLLRMSFAESIPSVLLMRAARGHNALWE